MEKSEEIPLKYERICSGIFHSRPNRFVALVEIEGREEVCHVKNTGRCRELLLPGARVILQKSDNPARRTAYDLIAVWKADRLINMDAQAPNVAAAEWMRATRWPGDLTKLTAEQTHGDSRFDFAFEAGARRGYVEVKGVTLEENGVVRFPDAPTARGAKHLRGLTACVAEGLEACVLFVVQMSGVEYFTPNEATDPDFAAALREASACGVRVTAVECAVTEDSMTITREIPVRL